MTLIEEVVDEAPTPLNLEWVLCFIQRRYELLRGALVKRASS